MHVIVPGLWKSLTSAGRAISIKGDVSALWEGVCVNCDSTSFRTLPLIVVSSPASALSLYACRIGLNDARQHA